MLKVKDAFGTEIFPGNIVAISKGTRGHRDLIITIVSDINDSKSTTWMKTHNLYTWKGVQLSERRHKVSKNSCNDNIVIVENILARDSSTLKDELFVLAGELKNKGILPGSYILGESIKPKSVSNSKIKNSNAKKVEDVLHEDLLSFLGTPESLS